jgi:hypothetical protein
LTKKTDQPNRPITEALTALGVEPTDAPYDPIEALASLMDLRGSVELARHLTDLPEPADVEPSHPASVLALTAKVIEDVRTRIDFSFENAFRPRFRLPDAQRAWNILQRSGVLDALGTGTKRQYNSALKSATRIIWAPFGEFLETRLKRARFALRELRDELQGPLAGLSLEAGRLERMDAALRTAIQYEVDRLYRRVNLKVETSFGQALREALDELPDVADQEGFSIGFCSSGWLGDVFGGGQTIIRSVIEHEIGQIHGLVQSAVTLHTPES